MRCADRGCHQGRQPCPTPYICGGALQTHNHGAVIDTQFDQLANSEEPDLPYWREWVPVVLLAVVCVALYASWVYWR